MSGDGSAEVVVTGATGFIAKHCIAELIRQGHRVRASVRDLRRGEGVRYALARAGVAAAGLELVRCDLTEDQGWAEAFAGCSVAMHVASPFPLRPPRDPSALLGPARDGTLRVLRAATDAGIRRVVLTSSIAACIYPSAGVQSRTYTERDWTDPQRPDISSYVASKTIAERAAWDFVRATPGAPELVVLNPGFVQGPALDADVSSSHELLLRVARGLMPAAPRAGFALVDVRDVASAHVIAAHKPSVAGERFLLANGYMTLLEMGRVLAHALPDLAHRVPRFELPDALVRLGAWVDGSARAILPDMTARRTCDASKARAQLGLTFRSAREALTSAAQSLRELKAI